MKKFICLLLICSFCTSNLLCDFTFSSKDSTVWLQESANLVLSAPIDDWNGTLVQGGSGGTIQGSTISFVGGRWINTRWGPEGYRDGRFTLSPPVTFGIAGPTIVIPSLMSMNGPMMEKLIVSSGTFAFINGNTHAFYSFESVMGHIELENSTCFLKIGLDSPLETSLILNGGIVELTKDLLILNSGGLIGPGHIYGKGNALQLGLWDSIATGTAIPHYEYTTSFTFEDVGSLRLGPYSSLKATWTFEGYNVIEGRATVLDLSDDDAKLVIDSASTLMLKDVYIDGMETDKIFFVDETSNLRVSGGKIVLGDDVLMTTGSIFIGGSTTILTGSWGWIFTDSATLDATDNALWIDPLNLVDDDATFGQVDSVGTYGSLINTFTVRQVTDRSQVLSAAEEFLLSGAVTGTVHLDRNFFMHPTNQVRFVGDTLLTASGAGLYFSTVNTSQLKVMPFVIAAFQDIKLVRTNNETFQIQPHGSVSFDPKVAVEFSEDMNITTGVYRLTGDDNICLFKGIGGQKRLAFSSVPDEWPPIFALRGSILSLEDINLSGLEFMNWETHVVDGETVVGALALKGKSILNIDQDLNMNIIVEGRGNEIHLLENDLRLSGNISFGDQADNSLTIRFALQEDVEQLRLYLSNGAISLSSDVGRAGLRFEDYDVEIVNSGPNSFVAGAHSYLGGSRVTITQNPIKQLSSDFELESGLDLKSGLDNPINISFLRSPFSYMPEHDFTTVYHRLPKHKEAVCKAAKKRQDKDDGYFASAASRAIRIPNPNLRIKKRMKSGNLLGSIRVESEGELTDFSPDSSASLLLELSGGARVYTRVRRTRFSRRPARSTSTDPDESIIETIKNDDKVYVTGTDNKIIVTGYLDVKGEIIMDEDAELIFEFDDSLDTEKTVVLGNVASGDVPFNIELPKSSSIIFQGSGNVKLGSDMTVVCNGTLHGDLTTGSEDSFEDDRPSLIFKNFTRLLVEEDDDVLVSGRGIVSFQDYAQLRVTGGTVQIGNASDDFFDLTVDRAAGIKVGAASSASTSSVFDSRISLPIGTYNITCDRSSSIEVLNGGLFEISLLSGEYYAGKVNSFIFDGNSQLRVDYGGRFALGQERVFDTEFFDEIFVWDNVDSTISGDGYVALFTQESSQTPAVEGKIQQRCVSSLASDAYNVVKNLIIVNPDKLDTAVDFLARDSGYNLITSQNKITEMDTDDVISYQDDDDGYVYGTKVDGRAFRILPDGNKDYKEI